VIQDLYERFIKCASYSILHSHAITQHHILLHPTNTPLHDGLSHIMVILEQFINASDGRLRLSFLEKCYPYTLLRCNYIALYEQQTEAYMKEQDEVENKEVPRAPVIRRGSKAPESVAPLQAPS
jgi:hypothetical protein